MRAGVLRTPWANPDLGAKRPKGTKGLNVAHSPGIWPPWSGRAAALPRPVLQQCVRGDGARTASGPGSLTGHRIPGRTAGQRAPALPQTRLMTIALEDVSIPAGCGVVRPMKHETLVLDDLWEAIEPFLPKEPPKSKGGRTRVPARAALAGIVFVLKTGIPWQMLPTELGCGSGSTCWRRLRDWQEAGVWEKLHTRLLNWLGDQADIDWSRASVDSLNVRAKRGVSKEGFCEYGF